MQRNEISDEYDEKGRVWLGGVEVNGNKTYVSNCTLQMTYKFEKNLEKGQYWNCVHIEQQMPTRDVCWKGTEIANLAKKNHTLNWAHVFH